MSQKNWYMISAEESIKQLNSSKNGLTRDEVLKRQLVYKKNIISEEYKINALKILFNQTKSFMVILLFIAAAISLLIGELIDFYLIAAFILIIVFIGFFQEFKAESIVKKLKKMTLPKVKVLRDGTQIEISSEDLVPGDVIILLTGDKVPADCRIIESHYLEVDESLITGESMPVKKNVDIIKNEVGVSDRLNMIYSGSTVTHGRCIAIVTETGSKTEIGKIAKIVSQEEEKTPLSREIENLGKNLVRFVLGVCLLIFVVIIFQGMDLRYAFLAVLALAVSTVPESLPIIITVSLSVGANTMAKRKALVRKFVSIESLASIDVICTDKTGTLTRNELTVREIYTNKKFYVTGSGYIPKGEFIYNGKPFDPLKDERLVMLLKASVFCNNAVFKDDTKNYWIMGSPLEGALIVLARKAGIDIEKKEENVVLEIPFDSQRKMMSVVYNDRETFVFSKGAPEILLEKCSYDFNGKILSSRRKKEIISVSKDMAKRGLRALALAYRKTEKTKNIENNLIFIGLIGMVDPPRQEAKEALKKCKEAGINVKIITGDHELTTLYVAREVGMKVSKTLNGKDIDNMSFDQLVKVVDNVDIFSRVTPEHKIKIVKALRENGHRVLFTGDGVNDAPAIKMSEVGIAMGKGTEVAKEASDIILVEEDFETIVNAVEEGRRVYQNIRNSVVYLVSTSSAEIFVILASVLSGLPFPYSAKQILWLNIVTEGIPATGFAFEKGEKNLLKEKPKDPKNGFLSKDVIAKIVSRGLVMFLGTFIIYYTLSKTDIKRAATITFNTMIWFELFNAVNSRSEKTSAFKMRLKDNIPFVVLLSLSVLLQTLVINMPVFQEIMGIQHLTIGEFLMSIAIASIILILVEIKKTKYNYLPF
ncbi:MAG: cation-transporting P-type ATPase [candidate division WOR-3 bacterium]